jgi:hypothetical protein
MSVLVLNVNTPIVDDSLKMTSEFRSFVNAVKLLGIIEGSGSPEGVVEALPTQRYMDTAGTAGAILYIKRDADIGGDKTQGWILV